MALYDPATGGLAGFRSAPTPNFLDLPELDQAALQSELLTIMARMAAAMIEPDAVAQLGVAFAGPIDASNRIVAAPTIWGNRLIAPIELIGALRCIWPRADVGLLNDVTAAGYRHVTSDDDSFCIVTVSSGIGNKIFLNGRPVIGAAARGGELGHFRVDFDDSAEPCDCGGAGHLGAIASGRGTLRYAHRMAIAQPDAFADSHLSALCAGDPQRLDNRAIAAAFAARDDWTWVIVRDTARHLARALASLHVALGLELFVIYGGFASALGEPYRALLAEQAEPACWNTGQDWNAMVVLDKDAEHSGLAGAGRYMTLRQRARALA
jgi:glucokinase